MRITAALILAISISTLCCSLCVFLLEIIIIIIIIIVVIVLVLLMVFLLLLLLHLLYFFINLLFVFRWHFVIYIRHHTRLVVRIIRHIAQNLNERWNVELLTFRSRLDTQNARLPVNIRVRFHKEIITLVYETLSNFPYLFFGWVSILELLNVFASGYLFFLLNFLIILNKADLARINEGVILANLPQEVNVIR